jgi:hypothetical protein
MEAWMFNNTGHFFQMERNEQVSPFFRLKAEPEVVLEVPVF